MMRSFGGVTTSRSLVETRRRRLRPLNEDVGCCVCRFVCYSVPVWNVVKRFGNSLSDSRLVSSSLVCNTTVTGILFLLPLLIIHIHYLDMTMLVGTIKKLRCIPFQGYKEVLVKINKLCINKKSKVEKKKKISLLFISANFDLFWGETFYFDNEKSI